MNEANDEEVIDLSMDDVDEDEEHMDLAEDPYHSSEYETDAEPTTLEYEEGLEPSAEGGKARVTKADLEQYLAIKAKGRKSKKKTIASELLGPDGRPIIFIPPPLDDAEKSKLAQKATAVPQQFARPGKASGTKSVKSPSKATPPIAVPAPLPAKAPPSKDVKTIIPIAPRPPTQTTVVSANPRPMPVVATELSTAPKPPVASPSRGPLPAPPPNGEYFEVVLSDTSWDGQDDHPIFRHLVEEFYDSFFAEGGTSNTASRAIEQLIYRLFSQHRPIFVSEQKQKVGVVTAARQAAAPVERKIINRQEIWNQGHYRARLIHKIRGSFLHAKEQRRSARLQKADEETSSLLCDEEIEPFLDPAVMYHHHQQQHQQHHVQQQHHAQQHQHRQAQPHHVQQPHAPKAQQQKKAPPPSKSSHPLPPPHPSLYNGPARGFPMITVNGAASGTPAPPTSTSRPENHPHGVMYMPHLHAHAPHHMPYGAHHHHHLYHYPYGPPPLHHHHPPAHHGSTPHGQTSFVGLDRRSSSVRLSAQRQGQTRTSTGHIAGLKTPDHQGKDGITSTKSATTRPDKASKRRASDLSTMDAVSKRLKPTLAASAAAALKTKSKPSTLASVMDRKIINGVFEPVVFVDKLTYDWSSLKLDGAAAWNALLKQKMFDNPALYKSIPQVTAMDTFRLAQGLKDALQTIQPPENSPLHKVTNESVSSSTFVPSIASDCPDDLLALFPKLATVYHDMVMQDCALMDRESTSILLRSYQYMTADEVRAHLAEAELDVTTLAAQQEEILHASQQLGLFAKNASDEKREGRKTKQGAVAATEVDGAVVAAGSGSADDAFWEADFAALLKQNGVDPATRYVMAHDQF